MSKELLQDAAWALKDLIAVYPETACIETRISAGKVIDAINAELAKPEQDFDLLKATQESLREHMSKVKELEAELAKPEQDYEIEVKNGWFVDSEGVVVDPYNFVDGTRFYLASKQKRVCGVCGICSPEKPLYVIEDEFGVFWLCEEHLLTQTAYTKSELDWSLLNATQHSLIEHMARIKELEAELAKQKALDKKADNARELGLDYEVEQEPVAWMLPEYGDVLSAAEADGEGIYNIPLYTAPLINKKPTKIFGPNLEQILNAAGFYKREWVGLTDKNIEEVYEITNQQPLRPQDRHMVLVFAQAVEAKLKEKNNAI
jgi:uncharacterized coiled-coil protein SlyX